MTTTETKLNEAITALADAFKLDGGTPEDAHEINRLAQQVTYHSRILYLDRREMKTEAEASN